MARFSSALLASIFVLTASIAHASCPQIPENKVWGKVGNDAIARYVEQHGGKDWSAYIAKWESRLERVQTVAKKNSVIVFHNNDLWLRGDDLDRYVRDVQQRLAVTRCMARVANSSTAPGESLAGTPSVDGT